MNLTATPTSDLAGLGTGSESLPVASLHPWHIGRLVPWCFPLSLVLPSPQSPDSRRCARQRSPSPPICPLRAWCLSQCYRLTCLPQPGRKESYEIQHWTLTYFTVLQVELCIPYQNVSLLYSFFFTLLTSADNHDSLLLSRQPVYYHDSLLYYYLT